MRLAFRYIAAVPSTRWAPVLGRMLALAALLLMAEPGAPTYAQPDSVRTALLQERGLPPNHTPAKALWRAAAVPGWGQVYNRHYLKLPFVYAGLAGLAYAIYSNNDQYLLYRHAHLFKLEEEQTPDEPNPFAKFEGDYNTVVERVGGDLPARQLRSERDRFRRWRDLSIVGTGLFYVLTLVDAYVSAHLLTFDVGDELAMRVRPRGPLQRPVSGRDAGGVGVSVTLQF